MTSILWTPLLWTTLLRTPLLYMDYFTMDYFSKDSFIKDSFTMDTIGNRPHMQLTAREDVVSCCNRTMCSPINNIGEIHKQLLYKRHINSVLKLCTLQFNIYIKYLRCSRGQNPGLGRNFNPWYNRPESTVKKPMH